MSEFVYLYRTTNEASQAAMGSPEQMQKSMQAWMAWMKQLADRGHIKDQGHPLERTGKLITGRKKTVTDGPYAETKDIIGGYTLIEARDLDQAVELSLGCPIFEGGGVVEVRPVRKLDM
ncbi:MAG TPA: YciI family protein [Gemmatimonadales bacterium]|nr:YciI family protein [Gemmatimonadales bacterium]